MLVDALLKRTAFLSWAVDELGCADRVEVVHARAEDVGRDPRWRGRFALAVARSFARPAVTAECAAGMLRPGGRLAVSEPPAEGDGEAARRRWPAEGLEQLGMAVHRTLTEPHHLIVLRQVTACGDRYPRRAGIPAKRPLF